MWDDSVRHFWQNTLIKPAHSLSLNIVKQVSNFQRKLISRGTALSRSISPSSSCPDLCHPLRELSMPSLGGSWTGRKRQLPPSEHSAQSRTGLKSELPLSPVQCSDSASLVQPAQHLHCDVKLWVQCVLRSCGWDLENETSAGNQSWNHHAPFKGQFSTA